MNRGLAWRALWGASIVLLLGGPTPGAVGSCGSDELGGPADVKSYCSEREQLICVRRNLRRTLSKGATDECRRDAIEQCESRAWAPQCQPTERVARACLNALRALDTLQTPDDELEECKTSSLCKLHTGGPRSIGDDDAGMDAGQ